MTSNPSGTVTLDAAGNTLAANGLTFEYDQAGRLAAARSNGALLGQYAYSFDGHRALKTVQGATTLFHYGADDNLLAETDAAGTTLKEYVWDDQGRPLAQISGGVVTYLHPDHLGSPRVGTDSAKNVVWQWQDLPFGVAAPTGSVTVALRYPGQYHEAETGLFQNWNRTYDKASGRYLESDPVGIAAGTNTFSYVSASPLQNADPSGLILPAIYACAFNPACVESVALGATFVGNLAYQYYDQGSVSLGRGLDAISAFAPMGLVGGGAIGKTCEAAHGLPSGLNGLANSNLIRFSQSSVSSSFRNGRSIQETIDGLRSGALNPKNLPPIRVFEKDGLYFTLDNRRLFVAHQAGVPVNISPATIQEISREAWKFTTPNAGCIVCVKGGAVH